MNKLAETTGDDATADVGKSACSELLPCPFCGTDMQDVELSPDCKWFTHPKVENCFFSEWEFDGVAVEVWNMRAR